MCIIENRIARREQLTWELSKEAAATVMLG
jgi:hypothetical protein